MAPGGKDTHLSPMARSGPGPERIDRFSSIFLRNFNRFCCNRNSEQHCETQHGTCADVDVKFPLFSMCARTHFLPVRTVSFHKPYRNNHPFGHHKTCITSQITSRTYALFFANFQIIRP